MRSSPTGRGGASGAVPERAPADGTGITGAALGEAGAGVGGGPLEAALTDWDSGLEELDWKSASPV